MFRMYSIDDYGFEMDYNMFEFRNAFSSYNINEMYMDVYSNEPYMLFSRVVCKNVSSTIENDRLVVKQNNGISILNIDLSYVHQCVFKKYSESNLQFIFNLQDIYYKILVIA